MAHPPRATHREFYGAVVETAGIAFQDPGDPLVLRAQRALANGDEHLNTIPLEGWDRMALVYSSQIGRALKLHGDGYSLGGGVCVLKEAVRQAVERLEAASAGTGTESETL